MFKQISFLGLVLLLGASVAFASDWEKISYFNQQFNVGNTTTLNWGVKTFGGTYEEKTAVYAYEPITGQYQRIAACSATRNITGLEQFSCTINSAMMLSVGTHNGKITTNYNSGSCQATGDDGYTATPGAGCGDEIYIQFDILN